MKRSITSFLWQAAALLAIAPLPHAELRKALEEFLPAPLAYVLASLLLFALLMICSSVLWAIYERKHRGVLSRLRMESLAQLNLARQPVRIHERELSREVKFNEEARKNHQECYEDLVENLDLFAPDPLLIQQAVRYPEVDRVCALRESMVRSFERLGILLYDAGFGNREAIIRAREVAHDLQWMHRHDFEAAVNKLL